LTSIPCPRKEGKGKKRKFKALFSLRRHFLVFNFNFKTKDVLTFYVSKSCSIHFKMFSNSWYKVEKQKLFSTTEQDLRFSFHATIS